MQALETNTIRFGCQNHVRRIEASLASAVWSSGGTRSVSMGSSVESIKPRKSKVHFSVQIVNRESYDSAAHHHYPFERLNLRHLEVI